MSKMNKKHLVYPLLVVSALLFASCNESTEESSSSLIESTTTSNPAITGQAIVIDGGYTAR